MSADNNSGRVRQGILVLSVAAALAGGGLWLLGPRLSRRAPQPVYTAQGYGGYEMPHLRKGEKETDRAGAPQPTEAPEATPVAASLEAAITAYSRGQYRDAEAAAAQVVARAAKSERAAERKQAARARRVLAFAAARRKDLRLARARFAVLQREAATLPDKGRPKARLGEAPPPTLEEEGAYQHAVCTGALGDRKAAEAEYVAFMKRYPESLLVHAAVKRIARFHGGDVPKEATAVWQQAMKTQQVRERAKQRAASLCAPECLAELLRRSGKEADVAALAKEMGTSHEGTTLLALAKAAKRHGYAAAQGLALTAKGLQKQKLPLIALVAPGHFVLVERVHENGDVTVWDANAGGVGKAGTKQYSRAEWGQVWQGGVALAVKEAKTTDAAAVKTAQR